jgi:hypothetical protein
MEHGQKKGKAIMLWIVVGLVILGFVVSDLFFALQP